MGNAPADAMKINGDGMISVPTAWVWPIEQWDKELRAAGRPKSTRYLRTYHPRKFAHDHRDIAPADIRRDHIIEWLSSHTWKPQTRRSYRSSLRLFFAWAAVVGIVEENPAAKLPTVALPRALPRPTPHHIVDAALRVVDERSRLLVLLLTFTGMRRAEVAKLHTDDLEAGLLGWRVRVVGKGGHERKIPIDPDITRAIRTVPAGYVFPGRIDGHLSAAWVGKLVSRALAGPWTAHTLRHRYASLAYTVERDLRAVQELLGHAQITTTQIYTLVDDSALRVAASAARIGLTAA